MKDMAKSFGAGMKLGVHAPLSMLSSADSAWVQGALL